MLSTHLVAAANLVRRGLPSLGLAAALLTATLGAPVSALADEPITRDHRNGGPPAARTQIVLKGVHIFDDRDWWGDGEMEFHAVLICFATPTPCDGYGSTYVDGYERYFSAATGETVPFDNQVMPVPGT